MRYLTFLIAGTATAAVAVLIATAPMDGNRAHAGYSGEEYELYEVVRAVPPVPLSRIDIEVWVDDTYSYGPAESHVCNGVAPGVTTTYRGDGIFRLTFPSPHGYRQSQALLGCYYFTHEPNSPAEIGYEVRSAIGIDGSQQRDDVRLCYTQIDEDNWQRTLHTHAYCGDTNADEAVDVSDALLALRAAIVGVSCPRECDVDGSASVTTVDALRILKFSVGHVVNMFCRCRFPIA